MLALTALSVILLQPSEVQIKVDPRFELLAVSSWLAGQYPAPADSAYKLKTWNRFRKFRAHPAIRALAKAKKFYTDFTELGIELSDIKTCQFRNSKRVAYWREEILGTEAFQEFAKNLPDFVRVSGFENYFNSSQRDYRSGITAFRELFDKSQIIGKLESFYRYDQTRPRPKYEVFLEPLNNWGAHAIVQRFDDEVPDNVVRYQLGFWNDAESNLDSPLQVTNTGEMMTVAWHEGSHVYINPVFTKFKSEYTRTERLFNRGMLKSQNITTWEYCLNENIVRGIVAAMVRAHEGEKAYRREVDIQVKRAGFIYVERISQWIFDEYLSSSNFKDFDEYFPNLIKHLDELPDFVEKG